MMFVAEIEQFSGPLDLMLHLISENKLNLFALDVTKLCDQYLNYLNSLQEKHLEIESSYLVELATLIELKSKKLLPPKPSKEEEKDTQLDLVKRLLAYQQFKDISVILSLRYQERQKQLTKEMIDTSAFVKENNQLKGNPLVLYKAMNRLMRRLYLSKPLETNWTRREISLEDCILKLKAKLINLNEHFKLIDILADINDNYEIVLSILAILDLAKNQILHFETIDGNIIFGKGGLND